MSIGNITSRTVGSNTFAYTYDTANKHAVKAINLNGVDYNYTNDLNGNMTGGPDFAYPTQVGTRTITYNTD